MAASPQPSGDDKILIHDNLDTDFLIDVDSDLSRREFFGLEFGVSHWHLRALNLALHLENRLFQEKKSKIIR